MFEIFCRTINSPATLSVSSLINILSMRPFAGSMIAGGLLLGQSVRAVSYDYVIIGGGTCGLVIANRSALLFFTLQSYGTNLLHLGLRSCPMSL
jgi:hypothetical protein